MVLPVAGARVGAKAAPADEVAVVKVVAARVAVVVVAAAVDLAIPGDLADTLRGGCPCARARRTPSGTAQRRPAAIS